MLLDTPCIVINLRGISPRNYQYVIETELTRAGYEAAAEAIHQANPRDLTEVWRYIPVGVAIAIDGGNE